MHILEFISESKQRVCSCKQNDMKILMQTASSPDLLEDVTLVGPLWATDGWQTLMTFAREHARA